MLKKLWMIIFFSILSASAFAEYGTYTGFNVGYNSTSYDLRDSTGTHFSLNSQYPIFGVFVGNGAQIYPHFYLGAEAFGSVGTGNTSYRLINSGQAYEKITSTYTYGADVMPGYIVNNQSLIYGRVGIAQSRIDLRGYITPLATVSDQVTSPRVFPGLRLGLGYEYTVNHYLKARAEYIHTFYQTFSVMDNAGWRDRLSPATNQIGMALAYEFL